MADRLEVAVMRFCAQLEREGYEAERKRLGAVYAIFACGRGGEVVQKYLAGLAGDGVHIQEVNDTGPGLEHN